MAPNLGTAPRAELNADPSRISAASFSQLATYSGLSERDWVVNNVLVPSLQAANRYDPIRENDDCFAPARMFRDQWGIKPAQWQNFTRLLCGCRQLPIILLQNPSNQHSKSYEEMAQCYTISYLSRRLAKFSLSVEQVPILAVCNFFSADDLRTMDEETRWKAVEASYKVTEDILAIIKPKVIICCQCVTLGIWTETKTADDVKKRETWRPAQNRLARQLCSKILDAKAERATPVDFRGHRAWAVKGFHPGYRRINPGEEPAVKRLFAEIFHPCGLWKTRLAVAKLQKMIDMTTAYISSLEVWWSEMGFIMQKKSLAGSTPYKISELEDIRLRLRLRLQMLERTKY
ncbi:hypothetical protein LZ31DRAFT_572342 [Colletotrichum somersetense]|nr:hypothetical protein LZ31DRAFT_572342 [Colletotrichum somersetense]